MSGLANTRTQFFLVLLFTVVALFDVLWQFENTSMRTTVSPENLAPLSIATQLHEKQRSVMDREFKDGEIWTARHKLRWVYKQVETSFYKLVEAYTSKKIVRYVSLLHYVVVFFVAYVFCMLIAAHILHGMCTLRMLIASFVFLGFVSSILHIGAWQEYYTPIEMMAIAAALYSGITRNLKLFFVSVLIAVLNRESGIAVGLIYPILNPQERWVWLAGPGFGIAVLALFNIDLLAQPEFYDVSQFIVNRGVNDITILNFYKFELSHWFPPLIHYAAFVMPIILVSRKSMNHKYGKCFLIVFTMYFIIMSVGSFIDNPFLFLMYIPIYFSILSCALISPVQGLRGKENSLRFKPVSDRQT